MVARGDSLARRRPLALRLVHKIALRLYAAFLVVGESNRAFYRACGVAPERLFDCLHFVDNARFAAGSARERSARSELRGQWRVPAGAICALFAGKLAPVKNLPLLFDALERALREERALYLLVAGDGELRASLEAAARRRQLPVTFAGFLNQSEMPRAYAAADLLVLPSLSETWGLVVNEAMASGLPAIVSSEVGCAPDLIREGETGWVFPSGDAGALAARLVDAARSPERLAAMGESAAKLVGERYSVERAVEGTLRALAWVAGEGRSG